MPFHIKISYNFFFILYTMMAAEDQRKTEVIDLWSEDNKPNAWFTQSALDIGFRRLESVYQGFQVYLFSGMLVVQYTTCYPVYNNSPRTKDLVYFYNKSCRGTLIGVFTGLTQTCTITCRPRLKTVCVFFPS